MQARSPGAIQVRNLTRGVSLGERVRVAATAWTRFVGLLGTSGLAQGEGLLLEPCNSVHMFFMRYPIDVVFASRDGRVLGLASRLRPWRLTAPVWGARLALELPVGVIEASGTCVGDDLALEVLA